MTGFVSANIDVCVPSAIAAHRERQARLKRIAARAFIQPAPIAEPEPEPITQPALSASDQIIAETNANFRSLFPVSIPTIQWAVCEFYHLTRGHLVGLNRTKQLTRARHVAIYLASEFTSLSIKEVGRKFCRDHSTVIYAIASIGKKIKTDSDLAYDVATIEATILAERGGS